MKHVVVLVSNDIVFDQRIQKTARTLEAAGYRVTFVGRRFSDSPELSSGLRGRRYRLPWRTGAGFYLALQVVFFFDALLRRRVDAIWANDLDTLFPARAVGALRGVPVVFDSHEFFTEHAGLAERPLVQWAWRRWESWWMPGVKAVVTVNDAIAQAFQERFPRAAFGQPFVVRNMPEYGGPGEPGDRETFAAWGVPKDLPIALLQGAYLDRDRGVHDAVAMLVVCPEIRLVLVGAGVEWDEAHAIQESGGGDGRLHCIPRQPADVLRTLTRSADVGLSLDRDSSGNYRMSLPNKLFDYVHAGIPVVATALPEVRKVVEGMGIGVVVEEANPDELARAIRKVLASDREVWRERTAEAAQHLHWGTDAPKLLHALSAAGCA